MTRATRVILLAGWVAAGAAGCASAPGPTEPVVRAPAEPILRVPSGPAPVTPAPVEPPTPAGWTTIGTSVRGRPIRAWVGGSGGRCVIVLGAIHGAEKSSRTPVDQLIALLERSPGHLARCRVIAIPVANPDGFTKADRTNAHGVDLNRNFPTAGSGLPPLHDVGGALEPETRALVELIDRERPDVIVSVHSDLGCVDYDGPALPLAQRMSAPCGLPVKKLGARPGSLGSFAGVERGIPVITLELRSHTFSETEPVPDYAPALLEALLWQGPPAAK